MKSYIFINF